MECIRTRILAEELERVIGLFNQVMDQTQRRVIDEEKVLAKEKVFSLFECHTDIIKQPHVKIYSSCNEHTCDIFVEDNGIGFDEQYLDRIFSPFQRLHGQGAYEGTGMGLAICRKIVERHGGSITAKSTPGAGSRFIVTLPLKQLLDR